MITKTFEPWLGPLFERRMRPRTHAPAALSAAQQEEIHRITIDSLLRDRYLLAFEPGCSNGQLTARLALRCDRVIAIDVSATSVIEARQRCSTFRNVRIFEVDVRTYLPEEKVDLIVFSELGHYFSAAQLHDLAEKMAERLAPDGELTAVHSLVQSNERRLYADQVHAALSDALPLLSVKRARYGLFRLDTWVRA